MTVFGRGPVEVIVPATSANLGPGFDALGLALMLHDRFEAEVTASGLHVDVTGEASDGVPLDETHLVVVAMRAAFDALGAQPPGLLLRCCNSVPHGRGLGSSASAVVGGIVVARALVADGAARLDDAAVLRLACAIEGHPDNVAAALHGGLTIAWLDDHGARCVRLDTDVRVVAFIPTAAVPTERARGLLPEGVLHVDAAFNAGRAALLVAALSGRPDLLLDATQDRLHQHYRASAMPSSYALVEALRSRGVAAVISGAGPSVLAFAPASEPTDPPAGLADLAPQGWRVEELGVDPAGARLTHEGGRSP